MNDLEDMTDEKLHKAKVLITGLVAVLTAGCIIIFFLNINLVREDIN